MHRVAHRSSVGSLEIPGIVVSLEIPVSPIFLVKNSGKIVNIGFSDSRGQNKILNFFLIFLYARYFLYKPPFPSSQASKTLKIESARSKSTGGPTYSSFGPPGATFSPVPSPRFPFFDQCFRHFAILGPLKACFDQLDR